MSRRGRPRGGLSFYWELSGGVHVRLAIFIDGGYLDRLLRDLNSSRVSYDRLARRIAGTVYPGIDLLRTYYYNCPPYLSSPPTEEEKQRMSKKQAFYDALLRLPRFEVRMGRLAKRIAEDGSERFEQKLVDVLLSIDLVLLSATRQITHAAIVAGDSDFIPAIKVAKNNGVAVWLFHGPQSHLHRDLWNVADERVLMDEEFFRAVLLEEQ